MFPPARIVCLTEETVETLYLLGEQDRIVGISGYVVRPPQARREKPRVSAFTSANVDKILALKPDLVLTFSDLQADIVADLIRRGIDVHAFNQRSVAGILSMIRTVGAMVGARERAFQLVSTLETCLADARSPTSRGTLAKTAKGILRGVGRSADLRDSMGLGAHRDRRRHRHIRRSRKSRCSEGSRRDGR
jgi:iron complex transport system substrate-binding protein